MIKLIKNKELKFIDIFLFLLLKKFIIKFEIMSEDEGDLNSSYYIASKVINGLCCIPYILLFIVYGIKIKQCNYSKITNIGLCFICTIMNMTYFFYDGSMSITNPDGNDDNPLCIFQGSVYVGCLIGVACFCFFISILFFMITVFPQTLEKHTQCFFLSFLIFSYFFWLFSITFLVTNAKFKNNTSIGFCRLEKDKNSTVILYIFMAILIVLTSVSIILAGIVIFCGKKISKTEEDYIKFKKKLRTTAIIQTICLAFLLINRFTESLVSNTISWLLDNILCISWVVLVSIHGYNQQTKDDIKLFFGIKKHEKEENLNGEDMCDILRQSFNDSETL